uniref:Uncharacterized protein n=1 Tax=Rhizophora mucronata TaxID=61149 RepID=A0A2P2PYS5_RHIMU
MASKRYFSRSITIPQKE